WVQSAVERVPLRRVTLEDVARIAAEQMAELARFVAQVNRDVLQRAGGLRAPYRPLAATTGAASKALVRTAKKNPVDKPHIRIPVSASMPPTRRHAGGSTRSP